MASDVVVEEVPKFIRRYGDLVYEGSNNTIIILGTDRAKKGPATVDDGLGHVDASGGGKGAGSIHIIAGRKDKDPDFSADDAFLYLSRKTKVDTNLGLSGVEQATDEKPSAVLKSDAVRIIARKDLKVCVNDDDKHYLYMDGKKFKFKFDAGATVEIVDKKITIKMGSNIIEMDDKKATVTVDKTIMTMDGKEVKIDSPKVHLTGGCEGPWDDLFKAMIDMMEKHNHMSAVGPTTPALAGPSTAPVDTPLNAKKSAWDSKVKS